MKISNLKRDKFSEAVFFTACQDRIQRDLFNDALRNAVKAGLKVAAGAAAITTLDYYLIDSGFSENVINAVVNHFNYLMETTDENLPRILTEDYRHWLLTSAVVLFGLGSLGTWGLNTHASNSYKSRNNTIKAVLSVPHSSPYSEFERYNTLTGNSEELWNKDLHDYFKVLAHWAKNERTSLALMDNNLQIGTKVPKNVFEHPYIRPGLEDIIHGLNGREDRKPMSIPEGKGKKVAFPLPPQPNQPQMYFEGYVFDNIPNASDFLGLEIVCRQLSSGEWVIGSCGPEKSKAFMFGKKKERLKTAIKDEILHSLYYSTPSNNDLSIALVMEGTYPIERGGVATLIHAMMRDIKPDYFNGQTLHYKVVPLLGFTGPYKTKISYEPPRNAHLNPPIIVYGHTLNPSLDIALDLPEQSKLFSPLRAGENKRDYRRRALKEAIFDLEDAIASCDIEGFYQVADRIKFFSADELLLSVESLEALHDIYHKTTDEDKPDFIRFQYQWRDLRQPLICVIKSEKVPADVYYSLLTGVGGVYAALAKREFKSGHLLQEHGIYEEDRLVDIDNSAMDPFFSRMWQQAFDFYAKVTYQSADIITTLCESNRQKQIREGAPEEKIIIIPAGISLDRKLPQTNCPELQDPNSFTVGMLGNVQPVKRAELFVSVAEYLLEHYPIINWQFHVMGNDDPHAKSYAAQIHNRVEQNRRLLGFFHFSGYSNYVEAFAPLDIGVLTSSSEVLPVSIMEFISLGKPMIAMDVGGISELVYGIDINGKKIDEYGPAGLLVPASTSENVVKGVSDAIVTMYLRKYYSLTGKRSDIPEPTPGTLDYLLNQRMPIEQVGPKRVEERFSSKVVLPQYAEAFMKARVRAA